MTDLEIVSGLSQDERSLLMPLVRTTRTFWLWSAIMASVSVWGAYAYYHQLSTGLGVTGLNTPEYWGIYIICFVFFIGISHAGTLISAILRVANAEWRRSITRSAEFITVLVIGFGAVQPILDLGRPDRVLNVFLHAQPFSPLLWDVLSITLYFTASSVYLYVPMIPDLARIRDLGLRPKLLYRFLAIGYQDTPQARHTLERIIGVLAIAVIPIAVSVHTVIGWIFALTLRPMWHSAIFGPYFVVGAIFSGIAALIIAMAILRRVYHLEAYFKDIHFNHMGLLLLLMSVLWFYFTLAENLTVWYGGEETELATLYSKLVGEFALPFWLMVAGCLLVPFPLMARRATRNVVGMCRGFGGCRPRHVAGALQHRCPDLASSAHRDAFARLFSVVGRAVDHGGDFFRVHPRVHGRNQVLSDHFDLGDQGRSREVDRRSLRARGGLSA